MMKEEFFKKVKEVVEKWYLEFTESEDAMDKIQLLINIEDEKGDE